MKTLSITNEKGLRFNLALISSDRGPKVEFYDDRYKRDGLGFSPKLGQFIGRYYLSTLQKRDKQYGLDLHGGVPDWGIDRQSMLKVHQWMDEQ